MIQNAGFEGISRAGAWTRQCFCATEHPEIFVPEGWTAFHSPALPHPEMHVIQLIPPYIGPPCRIDAGQWAVKLFKSFSEVDAGVYQVVTGLTPGRRYRAGFRAHAWCNTHDLPNAGLANCAPHGCGPLYRLESELPALNGDPVNDSWWGALFSVGVGPASPDPWGDEVQWGPRAAIYNVYADVPALEFVATECSHTIYVHAELFWKFRNNDAYMDSVYLVEVDEPEPEPEPPCECRGLPRFQYERTVNVIPASATDAQAAAVFAECWARGRETVTGSYDDAGIGALDVRRARLYGIPSTERADYEAFYQAYYPGVEVTFAWYPGETEPENQGEPAVSELRLAYPTTKLPPVITSRFGETAGRTVPHCGLDLRSSWAAWQDKVLCALPGKVIISGDVGGGFGVQVRTQTELADGRTVYVRYAHLVSSKERAQAGDMLAVGDVVGYPNSGGVSTGDHLHIDVSIDGPRNYVDPEPLIDWPPDLTPIPGPQPTPVPVARSTTPLGYHAQVWYPWMHTLNTELKMRLVKSVDGLENIYSVLLANPDCTFIYRQFGEQHTAMQGTPAQGAAVWIGKWIDSVRNCCNELERRGLAPSGRPYFLVESLNETYACFDPRLPWMVEFDREFIRQLKQAEPRVGAAVFCAPVGNPHESEFSLLTPLAVDVSKAGPWAAMSYHAYWFGNRDESGMTREHWPYLAGRWAEMDVVFRKAGAYPRWYFGESGVVGGRALDGASVSAMSLMAVEDWTANIGSYMSNRDGGRLSAAPWHYSSGMIIGGAPSAGIMSVAASQDRGYYLNPGSGWLDPTDCYGGNWAQYEADWKQFLQWCDETPAGRDGLVLGANPFSTGAPYTGWGWFQIQEAQYRALAPWLKARYL